MDYAQMNNSRRITIIGLTSLMILAVTLMVDAWLPNSFLIVPTGFCLLILNLMRIWFEPQLKAGVDFLIKWRWIVALIVFALLVYFEIHTSSAAAYNATYGGDPSVVDSVLFGVPRDSRSDEYNVQLAYYFSQYYNNYQEISHQMSVGGQNMILGYNAPTLGIAMLARPQTWGYLLFGNAKGIAWYFSFKNVMTFMAAFELTQVLTKSKYMGLFGGFFILYAPGMQWWFSPHFFDAMMWSMIVFDCGYYFVYCTGWKKWWMTLLSILALCGFVFAIFPSLQVPCGLLMLVLLLACMWRDKDEITYRWRDLFNVVAVLAGVGGILGYTFWNMREDLMFLLNTVYPGNRVSMGGYGRIYQLFTNVAAPIQPFVKPNLLNNSEFSQFNHFGIGCLLFYPVLWFFMFRQKSRQRFVGDVFVIAIIIETLFMLFPIPAALAKITLLSMCNRMQTVHGLTCALFTLWFVRAAWETEIPWKPAIAALACATYCLLSLVDYRSIMMPSFVNLVGQGYFIYMSVILAVVFWLSFTKWRQLFFAFMTGWTVISGVLINPIVQGTAAVTDYPIVQEARTLIDEDPNAWWLTLDTLTTQNLLLANGAKVLNATNFYPDYEKWEILDPELKNDEYYNRYANINVTLQGFDNPTIFENPSPDFLSVQLNPYDLIRLDVKYLVGTQINTATLDGMGFDYDIVYEAPEINGRQEIIFKIKGLKEGIELPKQQQSIGYKTPGPDARENSKEEKEEQQSQTDSAEQSAAASSKTSSEDSSAVSSESSSQPASLEN